MKVAAVLCAALAVLICSCDKQSYSETRPFTHHGEHGASHGDAAGHDTKATPPAAH